jgi:hypothetical protein
MWQPLVEKTRFLSVYGRSTKLFMRTKLVRSIKLEEQPLTVNALSEYIPSNSALN